MLSRGQHVQSTAQPRRPQRLIPGKAGLSGTQVLIGVPPNDNTGTDGTVYIDPTGGKVYQKTDGTYGSGLVIQPAPP